jgi:hypothetical protein
MRIRRQADPPAARNEKAVLGPLLTRNAPCRAADDEGLKDSRKRSRTMTAFLPVFISSHHCKWTLY